MNFPPMGHAQTSVPATCAQAPPAHQTRFTANAN